MHYKHLIWDWNGTLLDDVWLCIEIVNSMLIQRNLPPINQDRYRTIFDFPVKGYYELVGFSFDDEPFEELAAEFCDVYYDRVHECQLFEPVSALLSSVSDQGISQSILSATEQTALDNMVDSFDITHRFEVIVGQTDNRAAGKAETGKSLISNLDVDLAEVVLIGDTTHDLEVATQIGVDCLLVSTGHHSDIKLQAIHNNVIRSLSPNLFHSSYL